jgi:hypothetical protein
VNAEVRSREIDILINNKEVPGWDGIRIPLLDSIQDRDNNWNVLDCAK